MRPDAIRVGKRNLDVDGFSSFGVLYLRFLSNGNPIRQGYFSSNVCQIGT